MPIKKIKSSEANDVISRAEAIALSSLRSCYSEQGIFAGKHQFSDYWARDGLFASLGAIAIGDLDVAKKEIELMLRFQSAQGQIPLRVGQYFIGLKMLGISNTKELRPRYDQDKYGSHPLDQNSLLIISFGEYLRKTKDTGFLKKNYDRLKKAIAWSLSNDRDNDSLLEEGAYAGWTDSLRKKGKVLYTNILHCHALKTMSELSKKAGKEEDSKRYMALYQKTKSGLNRLFWNGRYYSDWISLGRGSQKSRRHDYFSTDGNVLSIILGIADRKQGLSIQDCIAKFGISRDVPSLTNHPRYPLRMQSLLDTLFGIGDYHNDLSWLWLGSLDALAKHRLGMKQEARAELEKIASIICLHNNVYEVYTKDSKPVNRLLYKSERPFAWSAGLFLFALKETGNSGSL